MEQEKEQLAASEQTGVLKAVYSLVKECPFLDIDVNFDMLDLENSSVSILSTGGAVIKSRNILGGFRGQVPFLLGYQGNPSSSVRKLNVVELLNHIGFWLERRPVVRNNREYILKEYPLLSEGRKIEQIQQNTVPYINHVDEKGNTTYICGMVLKYEKED